MPSSQVMHEFKHGNLHSGRRKGGKKGPIVTNRKQAIAIKLSEERKEGKGRKGKRKNKSRSQSR